MKISELLGEPQAAVSQPPRSGGMLLSARNVPEDSRAALPPVGRALGQLTTGEPLPMSWPSDGNPVNLDPSKWSVEQRWWLAAQSPASQLIIVQEPDPLTDTAWLALAPCGEMRAIPLLLMKLPCVTWTGEPISGGALTQSSG
jgi:hypothetical protein